MDGWPGCEKISRSVARSLNTDPISLQGEDRTGDGNVAMIDQKAAVQPGSSIQYAASSAVAPVQVFTAMEPLEKDWRRLERDNAISLHQSYDWCRAWVKTHGNPLAIVSGRSDQGHRFILPLEITRPTMIRKASFIGTRFTNINTGLFDPAFLRQPSPMDAAQFGAKIIAALDGRADLIHLGNVPLSWRGLTHPLAGLCAIENQNHTFQLPLLGDFEATLAQVNAKRRRKKYRNQVRKLEAIGGFEHVIASGEDQKAWLLDLFFQQKAVRFEALGLPDVFHEPETQAFFQLLLQSENGGLDVPLELHALKLHGTQEGKIAAIAGLSRKGDHVICQFGSIDESLAPEASPGELLFWLMIEQCCAEGASLFDFGIGDQIYKRSWCPVETVQHDILLPVTAIGHLAATAERGLTRSKAAIKAHPQLYGFLQKLRARSTAPAREAED